MTTRVVAVVSHRHCTRAAAPLWGDTVDVKDLMDRRGCDRPDRVGVGAADRGIAFGVALDDIEAIVELWGRPP